MFQWWQEQFPVIHTGKANPSSKFQHLVFNTTVQQSQAGFKDAIKKWTVLTQCLWHQKTHMMGYFSNPSLEECHHLLPSKQNKAKRLGKDEQTLIKASLGSVVNSSNILLFHSGQHQITPHFHLIPATHSTLLYREALISFLHEFTYGWSFLFQLNSAWPGLTYP